MSVCRLCDKAPMQNESIEIKMQIIYFIENLNILILD